MSSQVSGFRSWAPLPSGTASFGLKPYSPGSGRQSRNTTRNPSDGPYHFRILRLVGRTENHHDHSSADLRDCRTKGPVSHFGRLAISIHIVVKRRMARNNHRQSVAMSLLMTQRPNLSSQLAVPSCRFSNHDACSIPHRNYVVRIHSILPRSHNPEQKHQ